MRVLECTDEKGGGEEDVVERSTCGGRVYLVSLGGRKKTMMREFLVSDYQNRITGVAKTGGLKMRG